MKTNLSQQKWTLEIVPAHADQIHVFENLVSEIFVTMIPGTSIHANQAALSQVMDAGFTPVPHIAARNFKSESELSSYLETVKELGIKKALILAGGNASPEGPFNDSLDLLKMNTFLDAGIDTIAVAGHPEGNPEDSNPWSSLEQKYAFARKNKLNMEIVTQWSFSAEKMNAYIQELQTRNIDCPISIGIAGPASLKTLLKFAKVCGVNAASTVIKKQGFKMGRLLVANNPDSFLSQIDASANVHIYPFGGLKKCAEWLKKHQNEAKLNLTTV